MSEIYSTHSTLLVKQTEAHEKIDKATLTSKVLPVNFSSEM